ncbi:hypothetical protein SAMN04489841_2727 [Natrinema salaciae]|uniref:Uncharacterized protein n=1 Tax=Natrinema salaciae TaxID=1186196 RepID=A0A1H9JY62_9EURY|nr:hypothetical protein SAMN04489841_2727 [Natrinema salaciae]
MALKTAFSFDSDRRRDVAGANAGGGPTGFGGRCDRSDHLGHRTVLERPADACSRDVIFDTVVSRTYPI